MIRCIVALALLVLTPACAPAEKQDGIDPQGRAFDKVAPDERVILTGTEPFWTLTIEGGKGTWTTSEDPSGTTFSLSRFAGNNGLGFSGSLDGKGFTATLTPGNCSDGMSDRRYPYVATIALGGSTFEGCGYTGSEPFVDGEAA